MDAINFGSLFKSGDSILSYLTNTNGSAIIISVVIR